MAATQPLIWLIGHKGMLGSEVARQLTARGSAYVGTGSELDITDEAKVEQFAAGYEFTHIVNCAAYTAVDAAEDDEVRCREVNVTGAANVAVIAAELKAPLVHLSTLFVFNGTKDRPYGETDAPAPLNAYGRSKLDGETATLARWSGAVILRTYWLYGAGGANFVDTMLALMAQKEAVRVADDQWGNPTWTWDLAGAILAVVDRGAPGGVYHCTGGGGCSRYEWVRAMYNLGRKYGRLSRDCRIERCGMADFSAKAVRPAYLISDNTKIEAALGFVMPDWRLSLEQFIGGEHAYV